MPGFLHTNLPKTPPRLFITKHIGFYHTLGLYRIVVILAQIYKRYLAGQTRDERFAAFGTLIPLVAQAAADVAAHA